MNTFLFAWNPDKWEWNNLEQSIEELEQTGRVSQMWSCASHKSIQVGDRAFLIKLGKQKPRGIIGAGFVATSPFLAKHWSGADKMVPRVVVDFEALLNPFEEPILPIEILKSGNLINQHWSTQSSGISIKKEVTEELEAVWFNFLTTQNIRYNPFVSSENESQKIYTEGTPNQVILTKYERNPHAREECIKYYGLSCIICKFNFEEVYGDIGKNFIHVHHLNQISEVGKKYNIDPINDLRPVCPNCHSMIHKRKKAFSLKDIEIILNQNKKRLLAGNKC
ncbi:MAG: HNH endonuclease [Flavobacterium sp.]|nr:HNH endonuclease [Flavobacterium sp.]